MGSLPKRGPFESVRVLVDLEVAVVLCSSVDAVAVVPGTLAVLPTATNDGRGMGMGGEAAEKNKRRVRLMANGRAARARRHMCGPAPGTQPAVNEQHRRKHGPVSPGEPRRAAHVRTIGLATPCRAPPS